MPSMSQILDGLNNHYQDMIKNAFLQSEINTLNDHIISDARIPFEFINANIK